MKVTYLKLDSFSTEKNVIIKSTSWALNKDIRNIRYTTLNILLEVFICISPRLFSNNYPRISNYLWSTTSITFTVIVNFVRINFITTCSIQCLFEDLIRWLIGLLRYLVKTFTYYVSKQLNKFFTKHKTIEIFSIKYSSKLF